MAQGEVVVTGAGGALGAGVVRALAGSGQRVLAVERDSVKAEQAFAGLGGVRVIAFDVSQPAEWAKAMGDADVAGAVLIAGTWRGGARLFESDADGTWHTLMNANLETARASLQAVLPRLVARKAGSVVAIGSRTAVRPWEGARSAAYAASKAALTALSQAIAAEVLADGVRVNLVLPNTIDTAANRQAMPEADYSRWVTTDSLGDVVQFLLSEAARDISGAAIPVYGRANV